MVYNGNNWNFCDGFYCASIVFLAGFAQQMLSRSSDL